MFDWIMATVGGMAFAAAVVVFASAVIIYRRAVRTARQAQRYVRRYEALLRTVKTVERATWVARADMDKLAMSIAARAAGTGPTCAADVFADGEDPRPSLGNEVLCPLPAGHDGDCAARLSELRAAGFARAPF